MQEQQRSVGRPRDEDLSQRIVDETRRQIRRSGFSALRVGDVAAAVGCGVSTIYRRWPTREKLLAAAVAAWPNIAVEPSGNPREDLRDLIIAVHKNLGLGPQVSSAVIELANNDEDVSAAIQNVIIPAREAIGELIAAILGEGHPSIDLLVDSVGGVIVFRAAFVGIQTEPAALADEILATIDAITSTS